MAFRAVLLTVFALALAACSGGGETDITRAWSEEKLYLEAKAALDDRDYVLATDYYKKLIGRYPFGQYTAQGRLDLIYTYYRADEHENAIKEATEFIKVNPTHSHVAYAYYLKGMVNYNRLSGWWTRLVDAKRAERDTTNAAAAFADFAELVERFPESSYANDARPRMLELREALGAHELIVARHYMVRKAWVGAVHRATDFVSRFPSSPAVPQALEIMIEGYRELGLNELADDSFRVLEANYPDAAAAFARRSGG